MTLAFSTAEEKKLWSRQRQALLRWRVPAVVELRSEAAIKSLDRCLVELGVSPGGSGDLLSGTLFSMPSSGRQTKCKQPKWIAGYRGYIWNTLS